MSKVLIIDDDPGVCGFLTRLLEKLGYLVSTALTLDNGLDIAKNEEFDVVLLDVMLPDGDGLQALPVIRDTKSSPEVIIITGVGTPDGAELAVKNGAWDYLQKPLHSKRVRLSLNRVLAYRESKKNIQQPTVALDTSGIVGRSRQVRTCLDTVAQAAGGDASVMITGETGTGKELFARSIHFNSLRSHHNFVVVDCAALPETLVQSSLFGYEKGSFTGAEKSTDGLIKQANGGTLFLDEVGDLSLNLQKIFLRVLQEGRFRPVGGNREIESNFRLIAATNKDPEKLVTKGLFRHDLLYRLRSITLDLPPLREHARDIKELAVYYTTRICEKYGIETKGFSVDFFDALQAYNWPGNVRELIKALEGAISKALHEPILVPKHLPDQVRIHSLWPLADIQDDTHDFGIIMKENLPPNDPLKYRPFKETVLADAEKKYFQDLVAFTKGDLKQACEVSGLSRTRLYTLLKKHGVSRLGWSSDNFKP